MVEAEFTHPTLRFGADDIYGHRMVHPMAGVGAEAFYFAPKKLFKFLPDQIRIISKGHWPSYFPAQNWIAVTESPPGGGGRVL
jgi:hypothetical protein